MVIVLSHKISKHAPIPQQKLSAQERSMHPQHSNLTQKPFKHEHLPYAIA